MEYITKSRLQPIELPRTSDSGDKVIPRQIRALAHWITPDVRPGGKAPHKTPGFSPNIWLRVLVIYEGGNWAKAQIYLPPLYPRPEVRGNSNDSLISSNFEHFNTWTPEHFNTDFPETLPNVSIYQHTCLRDAVRQASVPIYPLNYPGIQTQEIKESHTN